MSFLAAFVFSTLYLASDPNLSPKINADLAPCRAESCPASFGLHAKRLNDAYFSPMTTEAQRDKLLEVVRLRTHGDTVEWGTAAEEYFNWRSASTSDGQTYIAAEAEQRQRSEERKSLELAEQRRLSEAARERDFRLAVERAVRARLVDPSSAEFVWPYSFSSGSWKPFLRGRINGFVTCGTVNARNRMGGYNGAVFFAAVLDSSGSIKHLELGTGTSVDYTATACSKGNFSPALPLTPEADGQGDEQSGLGSELEALARLKEKGLLTEAEFDAAKQRLLITKH